MITNEDLIHDNTDQPEEEPAYRKPGVQNFRSLHSDTLDTAKKQTQSVAQIIISAKEKQWHERQQGIAREKVRFQSIYERPIYKILLVVLVVLIAILFGLRSNFTKSNSTENNTSMIEASATTSLIDITASSTQN